MEGSLGLYFFFTFCLVLQVQGPNLTLKVTRSANTLVFAQHQTNNSTLCMLEDEKS